ncbi:MAG: hypothetical protein HY820_05115 [Acidobacteria bacterium]|nr:hypothetical protein [Acidobacteriota bacterium]
MSRKAHRDQVMNDAWIGDAVLELYVRLKILREDSAIDGAKAQRMSSNQFLSVLGEPSETEAAIGRVYLRDGLDAAFRWIEHRLMPHYDRQEAVRQRAITTHRY